MRYREDTGYPVLGAIPPVRSRAYALVGVDYHVGDIFVGFIVRDDFLEGSYCTLNCGEGVFVYQDDKTLTRYCKDIYEQNEIKYSDLLNIQK